MVWKQVKAKDIMSQEEAERDKQEEEYIEEEDEDFDPENGDDDNEEDEKVRKPVKGSKKGAKGQVNDDGLDYEKEVKSANYSRIESSEGGLIKTRTQRAQEELQSKQYKDVNNVQSSVDVNDLWKQLQEQSQARLKNRYSSSSPSPSSDNIQPLNSNEQIKIKRKYEFAGEIVTEEKLVNKDSAEAREYLNSIKNNPKSEIETKNGSKDSKDGKELKQHDGPRLRIKRKRPPLLEGIISGAIKPKFNTLEKSKLDFAQFVDKEGIDDELRQHNKDGYLERQDFLSRVEFFKDNQIKEIRKKELANKQ
ncbi:SWR1-complex protein [Wickerhamomyces ciferrii]|uniref:SWR1-complex protein 5 n=1 Tax=Wickerhamomyces ciferrii (strain ATCC 14091 / BCRC 22168 / CBS 111 / JCM 3599 / NBRC 0793 / NRRL Y-1031 F-60-10) TaxID=1206466 RepID=K0K6M9_WICCF|nr:SWR1-complex protein [Wickerhamomyces ciferrii]CCH40575.1 SWR1-complex protein [Wickerhamomyces ciferrii]